MKKAVHFIQTLSKRRKADSPPASLETQRHRAYFAKATKAEEFKCGVYFAHGNTVAKINATLLGGRPEGEERFCALKNLFFLLELLQKGLREFQMRYSAA